MVQIIRDLHPYHPRFHDGCPGVRASSQSLVPSSIPPFLPVFCWPLFFIPLQLDGTEPLAAPSPHRLLSPFFCHCHWGGRCHRYRKKREGGTTEYMEEKTGGGGWGEESAPLSHARKKALTSSRQPEAPADYHRDTVWSPPNLPLPRVFLLFQISPHLLFPFGKQVVHGLVKWAAAQETNKQMGVGGVRISNHLTSYIEQRS